MVRLGPGQDLGVHVGGLLGRGVGEDLDLVELVHPQQAPGVAAGRARLAPEAARVGHEPHRQVGLVEDLVAGQRGERHLGGGDGPQVVALEVVGVVGELGQVAGATPSSRCAPASAGGSPRRRRRCGRGRAGTGPAPGWRPPPRYITNIEPDSLAPRSRSRMPSSVADVPVRHPLVLAVGGSGS